MRTKTARADQRQLGSVPTVDVSVTTAESEALRIVDDALARFGHRDLVAGPEVVDLLLDMRSAMGPQARFPT
ncbi:MAG TPA: hypothetical protein VL119_09830 [Acidimicrobiia bacterium]|nr:hypothetical protein [Acidimicrobiia bacterium]